MHARFAWLLLIPCMAYATAPVYRCKQGKLVTYSDVPCEADAKPVTLPPLQTLPPLKDSAKVKQFDQSLETEKAVRDKADAAFVKKVDEDKKRAQEVRAAILDHRLLRGMTESEVKSALGAPDSIGTVGSPWVYLRNQKRLTINFVDGRVRSFGESANAR